MNAPENAPYNIYDELSQYSIDDLIERFNEQVGNANFTGRRNHLLWALHHEFLERNIDFTSIGNEQSISLRHEIQYVPAKNKLVIKS